MEFEDYCYVPSKNTQISCSDNQSENDCDLSQFSSTNTTSNFSADFQHQQQHNLKQLSHQDLPSQHIPEQQQHLTQEMIQLQQYQQYILCQQQYYYYLQQNQNLLANSQLFQQQHGQQQQCQQNQHFFEFPQQFYQVSSSLPQQQQPSQYQLSQHQQHQQNSCFYSPFQQPQQISSNYFSHTIQNNSMNPLFYPQPQSQPQYQSIPAPFVYGNSNQQTFQPSINHNNNNSFCQGPVQNNLIYNQQQQQQQCQIISQRSNYQQAQGIAQKNTRIEAMRRRLTSVDTGKGGEIFRRYLPQRPRASLSF